MSGAAINSPFAKASPFGNTGSSFGSKPASSSPFASKNAFSALDSSKVDANGKEQDGKVKKSPFDKETGSDTGRPTMMNGFGKSTQSSSSVQSDVNGKFVALNTSFKDYVVKHVSSHPCCDLSPGLKDYLKHVEALHAEKKNDSGLAAKTSDVGGGEFSSGTQTALPTEKSSGGAPGNSEKREGGGFSFGAGGKNDTPKNNDVKGFSGFGSAEKKKGSGSGSAFGGFGSGSSKSPASAFGCPTSAGDGEAKTTSSTPFGKTTGASLNSGGFSFGGGSSSDKPTSAGAGGFSFGGIKAASGSEKKEIETNGEEEEGIDDGEPSKNVAEEAAPGEEEKETILYSVRAKLFVMKEGWVDLGVGALKINEFKDTQKRRLVMRTETVGKVILNTYLFPAMKAQKEGKSNVSVICLGEDGQPQKYLIRIKLASDADDLISKIEELKK